MIEKSEPWPVQDLAGYLPAQYVSSVYACECEVFFHIMPLLWRLTIELCPVSLTVLVKKYFTTLD